ncbi:MAG: sulfotransferase [Gammaproteobacteria bacterium]|nr:sulfotransferase [Gammaproteobacteria bacterium]
MDEDVYAINSFSRVVELQPDNAYGYYLFASACHKIGKRDQASELSNKAIELNPNLPGPYVILGQIYHKKCKFHQAIDFFEKAILLKPSQPMAYLDMVACLRIVGRHEDALRYAKKLLRLETTAINHLPVSNVLIDMGKMEEATTYLEKALEIDSTCAYAYQQLAQIKKFTTDDNTLIRKAEKALQQSIPAKHRSVIHFSLGKIYDDRKEWDKAFENYRQGNLLGRSAVEPSVLQKRFKCAKKAYNKKRIQDDSLYGSDSNVPVFIVGMPRSGTTLIEQIISAHPDGAGAGELTEILKIHSAICFPNGTSSSGLEKKLSKEMLAGYADDYLRVLKKTREGAVRIVDKLPNNFTYLGLIHLLFPNARIIHAIRNPLDVCLSCYFQSFSYEEDTYDIQWLIKKYHFYRKTIEYWKKLLPEGKIIDVHYEDLISDFESQSHRLIEFCGLPWDDRCLEFYKAPRAIVTASVWQARQPIYTGSRKRWHNYAPYLDELANGLCDYLDDEDIAELAERGIKVKRSWNLGFFK